MTVVVDALATPIGSIRQPLQKFYHALIDLLYVEPDRRNSEEATAVSAPGTQWSSMSRDTAHARRIVRKELPENLQHLKQKLESEPS
jgi:hypothetical protein